MTGLDSATLLLAGAFYYGCFYLVARLGERGRYAARLLNHPLVYVLSLGVIISTWSFYTAFISASTRGFGYNAYYLGYAIAFLFMPVLLQPLLRITRTWQLGSLPDLFAFRFRSPLAGTLTTLALMLSVLPLLALQYLGVETGTRALAPDIDYRLSGPLFCVLMIFLTLRFGTRDVTGRERNGGIVAGLAFESAFKLAVLLITGGFAIYGVFGGFAGLDAWLASQPPEVTRLQQPFLQNSTNLLVLMFFSSAVAMPHMFHMIFHENRIPQHLPTASWGMPLYLLLVSLPVLPMLWAREYLGDTRPVQFAGLMLGMLTEQRWLSVLFYCGGLAAASGLTIVLAMSVSNMCMNHLLLRLQTPPSGSNLYAWLLRRRRLLIVSILTLGYLLYRWMIGPGNHILDTGFVSFISTLQFLPGIFSLLYWPRGNRQGYIGGLLAGTLVWVLMGLVPLLGGPVLLPLSLNPEGAINWNFISSLSLLANLGTLLILSLCTSTRAEERRAARRCSPDHLSQTPSGQLTLKTPSAFVAGLTPLLGSDIARREVTRALADLGLDFQEQRAQHIQQLRIQIETNLSALLGPSLAHQLLERFVPRLAQESGVSDIDLNMIESQLESWPGSLSGIALDLDALRRHHRRILQELPIGVCSVDREGLIILWNNAMRDITGLDAVDFVGLPLSALPPPWNAVLGNFVQQEAAGTQRHATQVDGRQRWFNLHKASVQRPRNTLLRDSDPVDSGQVILLEDLTET
ncbi:MAG TPA: PAS domain-containing protein, partial [Hyphomicrobiales bacterium]|nr:PAS domain-containing protein [Hyphomicrobiales bacterium]